MGGFPATALGFNPPDADIMRQKPRGKSDAIISGWLFFRYMFIGLYIGIATVGVYAWWYVIFEDGPQISFAELTSFAKCTGDCSIFQGSYPWRASTMSLSVLVTIEMLNAFNALSENQSLLVMGPLSDFYLIGAVLLSFSLHFVILYTPWLATIFQVAELTTK